MSNHTDEEAVKATVRKYIDGTYHADITMLKSTFHEKAIMNGYLGPVLIMADPQPFVEDIASSPSMESHNDPYKAEITSIHVEGNVASAVISETGFRGDTAFVDFFHLIKIDDNWQIISKLFTTV